jgi:hypothetical protein
MIGDILIIIIIIIIIYIIIIIIMYTHIYIYYFLDFVLFKKGLDKGGSKSLISN